jgi:hypothetical protein
VLPFTTIAQSKYEVYRMSDVSIVHNNENTLKINEKAVNLVITFDGNRILINDFLYKISSSIVSSNEVNGVMKITLNAVDENGVNCQIILGNKYGTRELYVDIVYVSRIIRYYYK